MLPINSGLAVISFLLAGAAGACVVGHDEATQAEKPDVRPAVAKFDRGNRKPAAGRMFVTGRVLDPQGKPVPNASVMVYVRSNLYRKEALAERSHPTEIGRAVSDGSGRFAVDATRTSSSRHDGFGVVALAPGYGTGWVGSLDPDADQPAVDVTLRSERVIHGRLFDLQGRPAERVKLLIAAMRPADSNATDAFREDLKNPSFWWKHPDDLPGWPGPAVTGTDGRFTVHGVGLGVRVFLNVIDPRYISPVIDITTGADSAREPLSLALQPARTLIGRVIYADTGKPAANALVSVSGFEQFLASVGPRTIFTMADADGQFRANIGPDAEGTVAAYPADGQPYVGNLQRIAWSKGAVTHSVDLALRRGVMLRGKVIDYGSNRAVAGATVSFYPRRSTDEDNSPLASFPMETSSDGSFSLAVPAGRGCLVVRGPDDDYVLRHDDSGRLFGSPSGSVRIYAHAFVTCDSSPAGATQDVQVALRRGVTVNGRVIGPDGRSVADAWMLSRLHLNRRPPVIRMWSGSYHGTARNGLFELHGLDPDSEIPVSFFEPKSKLGATVRFGGKTAEGGPTVVTLGPCGAARARLVGPDGSPLVNRTAQLLVSMVVTPGEISIIKARKEGASLADGAMLSMIDPINHPNEPVSDGQGRVVFSTLIPGATYRMIDRTTIRNPNGPELRKEFTVKPGETLDLGDLVIEKP